ncbi:MAG: hypothetical protein R3C56_21935 [Pirellulaceae bacterium]
MPLPMNITAFISRVTELYMASDALVLPVDMQAGALGSSHAHG